MGPPTARRTNLAPWVSCHMRHSPTGSPAASTGTVLAHCPVHDTATICPEGTVADRMAVRALVVISRHHSSASWVAAPPGARRVSTGRCSEQAMTPVKDTSPTLGPPVPRSTARTNCSSGRMAPAWPPRDGSPVGAQMSAGMACCESIMSLITIRMKPSASSVIPPATPP